MKDRDGSIDRPYTIKQMQREIDRIFDDYEAGRNMRPYVFGRWGKPEAVCIPYGSYESAERARQALKQVLESDTI